MVLFDCEGPLTQLFKVEVCSYTTLVNFSGRFTRVIIKAVGEHGGLITESKLSAYSSSARCVNKDSLSVSTPAHSHAK